MKFICHVMNRETTMKILILLCPLIFKCGSILVSPKTNNLTETRASNYARLREDILQRPVALHKIPPNVEDNFLSPYPISFEILLVSVSKVEEINQVVTVDAFVEIRWMQKELSWNPDGYGGFEWININPNSVWCPSIMLLMGHEPTFVLDMPYDVQLYSNGTVVSNGLNHFSFFCDINFHRFPFDVQQCSVGFVILSDGAHPKVEIKVTERHIISSHISITNEWLFVNVTQEIIRLEQDSQEFPSYNFTLKRRWTYYVVAVIFPMVLTSVMVPLVFLIPAQTGEKISYLTAIFTSTAVFLNYISDVMPRNLSSTPCLAMLLIEVLVEGFLAILASLLVVNMYQKEEKTPTKNVHPENETFTKDGSSAHHNGGRTELLSAAAMKVEIKCFNIHKITSRRLDLVFFSVFLCGQIVILVAMFGFSSWLEN